jgi:hypothetical protein
METIVFFLLFAYLSVYGARPFLERTIFTEEGIKYRDGLGRTYFASYSGCTVIQTEKILTIKLGNKKEVVIKEDGTNFSKLRLILEPRVARFALN